MCTWDTLELRSYAPRGLWFPALVWSLHAALRSSRWWVLGSPVRVALFALFVCVCAFVLPFGSSRCNSGLGHKYLGCNQSKGNVTLGNGHRVTTVTYDMEQFLRSCVDRYLEVAGDVKLNKVVTPELHEETKNHVSRKAVSRVQLV